MRSEALLAELGRRLTQAREQAKLTATEVAQRAGLSRRYLALAEAGEANLSFLKLAALAGALHVPLRELCDLDVGSAPELRIALLGMRGAGKSTIGKGLAQELEVPFFELDRLVEERAGMPLASIFSIHGERYYRELQREALEAWLSHHGSGVLATGGSIVQDTPTFQRLCGTCRTVWLQATAEDCWDRVVKQGDVRPMRGNPRAFDQLGELLAERVPRYATADLGVDTHDRPPAEIVREIAQWALRG